MIISKNFQSFDEWHWNGQKSETICGSHRNLTWYRRLFASIDSQSEMFILATTLWILLKWVKHQGIIWWALPSPEWMMLCCDIHVLPLGHVSEPKLQFNMEASDVNNNSPPIGISLVAHLFGGSVSGAANIASQWDKGRLDRCFNESWAWNKNCKV